ncbi:MAG: hypothetical protein NTX82_03815, partial [Candidatus Parcubacteria bacterium]|nr:hypothetical protein [Candidatus Parcubacteria bacterium]
IIFEYKGKIYMTTRGRFVSPTGLIAQKMLDAYVTENDWAKNYNPEETILVEIIIPETKVHLHYEGFNDFILIGSTNRETLADYDFTNLTMISERLHLPLVRKWRGKSLEELKKMLKDRSIKNQEGFVVRFHGGLRSKFKFESYIGLMVQSKLSYTYLMQRKISGNLERMISTLPEEIYAIALQMVEKLNLTIAEKLEPKEKWQKLYLLIPEEDCTDYYKSICRKYVKTFYK